MRRKNRIQTRKIRFVSILRPCSHLDSSILSPNRTLYEHVINDPQGKTKTKTKKHETHGFGNKENHIPQKQFQKRHKGQW